jgi:hypothetical protein
MRNSSSTLSETNTMEHIPYRSRSANQQPPFERPTIGRRTSPLVAAAAAVIASAMMHGVDAKPLKVFILAGQSNATGMVNNRTLEHIKMFPETAEHFSALFTADGTPVALDDVFVSQWQGKESGKLAPIYGGGKRGEMFGPEYAFGIYMHQALQEPFLIIKAGRGGTSLNFDFRPPSAGEWTPPAGHPDLINKADAPAPAKNPIPETLDLPADWSPPNPSALSKKHMGLKKFKGAVLEETNGVHPIYVLSAPRGELAGDPFQQGDLILAVDGSGLGDEPMQQWRDAFHSSKSAQGDWMIQVTRWRKGVIETFDFDITETIEGGRDKLPEYLARQKEQYLAKQDAGRGALYRDDRPHPRRLGRYQERVS